ncbi:site-specific integrase [Dysgonomonas sp. 25]|uniref:site-specific integrase n=1 Tax=Dysgonomonas sp. 25 TaxID=2302933 RepID=UPI0013D5BE2B|nr:site-specific integrase [Dysgonomonas sp. 25]NDV68938.1 hypothetical protein [Dysgonomonas sp. 25]
MKIKYSINFRLEKRKDKETGELITKNIPIRMDFAYEGKRLTYFTGYRIDAEKWIEDIIDPETGLKVKIQRVKKNTTNQDGVQYNIINKHLEELKLKTEEIYNKAKINHLDVTNEHLSKHLSQVFNSTKTTSTAQTIFWDKWDEFLKTHKVSDLRRKQLKSTKNHLERFVQQTNYKLSFETTTPKLLADFEKFLLADSPDKEEYKGLKKNKIPRKKSQNTVTGILKRFRSFLSWCVLPQNGAMLKENPFSNYQLKGEIYGAPICMTKDERDYLYSVDIADERLSRVRDIFCFQCFVGCRVGDLITFTKDDIIDNTLIYYPNKTKTENHTPAKVPLSNKAKAILKKYDSPDGKLLPFISEQKYNDYLKELFEKVGLKRMVTRFNPLTMEKEKVSLSQIASSHLARRTFIHILHRNVKDSVIASMSGHVKGSKAFDRYYDVDDDTRQEAINKYLD